MTNPQNPSNPQNKRTFPNSLIDFPDGKCRVEASTLFAVCSRSIDDLYNMEINYERIGDLNLRDVFQRKRMDMVKLRAYLEQFNGYVEISPIKTES